jgi:hypothetical protein
MTNADVKGSWTKAEWCPGHGYIVEAQVTDKRRHTLKPNGSSDIPTRCGLQIQFFLDIFRPLFV